MRFGRAGAAAKPAGFDFWSAAERFENRVKESGIHMLPDTERRRKIGIVVTPWLFTPAPFFIIEYGLLLKRAGAEVFFLFDANNVFLNATRPREVRAIAKVLAGLDNVIDMSTVQGNGSNATYPFVPELLYENAVRHLLGESGVEDFLRSHPECEETMNGYCRRLDAFFSEVPFDSLLIPGGVWAASGVYVNMAGKFGIPFTTYDSGTGQLFVCKDSPAAHFGDIPTSLDLLLSSTPSSELDELADLAQTALEKRIRGEDFFNLQRSPKKGVGAGADILLVLNRRCDTAALCRHRVFRSVCEWVHAVLHWLEDRPQLTIAIRQHPCERIEQYRGRDSWPDMLAPFAHLGSRLRFIPAEEDVNTYDLIDEAKVVLPFTSRVGIESVMLGKPVVLAAECYYDSCGFTTNPDTRDGYFSAIEETINKSILPTKTQQRQAELVYYLMEYCTFVSTPFTPQPADFEGWMAMSPEELYSREEVQNVLKTITDRYPLAWWTHRSRQSVSR